VLESGMTLAGYSATLELAVDSFRTSTARFVDQPVSSRRQDGPASPAASPPWIKQGFHLKGSCRPSMGW